MSVRSGTTAWEAYMGDWPCSTAWRAAIAADTDVYVGASYTRLERGIRVYACKDCKEGRPCAP